MSSNDTPQIPAPEEEKAPLGVNIARFAGGFAIAIVCFVICSLLMPVVEVIVALSNDPSLGAPSDPVGIPQVLFGMSALLSFSAIGCIRVIRSLAHKRGNLWTTPFFFGLSTAFILEALLLVAFYSCAFCKLPS